MHPDTKYQKDGTISAIYNINDDDFYADLIIGFKVFRERFTSHVMLSDGKIQINYIKILIF